MSTQRTNKSTDEICVAFDKPIPTEDQPQQFSSFKCC